MFRNLSLLPALALGVGLLLATVSLPAAAPVRPEVVNAGVGGNNTADLLARLDQDVLAQRPDLVVLLAGTNDLLNSRNAVSLDRYRENLDELVRRIKAHEAKVILLTLPPVYAPDLLRRHPAEFFGDGGPASRLAAGNAVIHDVARENGLLVADVFAAFQRAGGATEETTSLLMNVANSGRPDGVHPTATGYRLIGELVATVIAQGRLGSVRRIVCFGDSITRGVHVGGEGSSTGDTYPAFLLRALENSHRGKH